MLLSWVESTRLAKRPSGPESRRAASLGSHHLHEFFVVHLAVTVNVGFADHLVNLLVGQLLAQISHHVSQFSCRDKAVTCKEHKFKSIVVIHVAQLRIPYLDHSKFQTSSFSHSQAASLENKISTLVSI